MNRTTIGRAIGAASLAFGVADMLLGRKLGRGIGAGADMGGRLFQIAGAREVITGVAGLAAPTSAAPVRWRLAGDIFDLAALAYIAAPANPKRRMALLAFGVVAVVAAVDFAAVRAIDTPARLRANGRKRTSHPKRRAGSREGGSLLCRSDNDGPEFEEFPCRHMGMPVRF